jgi:hypothetical protein
VLSLSSQSVLSFHLQRAAHQVRLPGGCSDPSHFSWIPLDFRPSPGLSLRCHRVGQRAQALDFPAPAYCVSQLLSTCFEFSHPCVHPFLISATAFLMLVMSEGALSQFLPDLVKARFSFPRQDLAA